MKKTFWLLAAALSITGCAVAPFVETSSTTFHGDRSEERGLVVVMPLNDEQRNSLAFKAVGEYLAKKLSEKGYQPVKNRDEAKFIAFISYGIDNGKTTVSSVPIFGQTGGGSSYSQGTITGSGGGYANYSGTTTTMKTYGVVGAAASSETSYKRDVNIDIFNVESGKPLKSYELRAISVGTCGNINSIIYGIIDGIFANFPGQSGKATRVDVKWDGTC